ncbi:MAG: alpha/beta hydrolase [Lachnospiraceae bacterium]|nr:alpha/beta hydrolase [Lachnospiraceae bacterium]
MSEIKKKNKKRIFLIQLCIELTVFVVIISIHFIQLKREEELRTPLGQLVEVNGHNMSVYSEGEGEKTLVFLSGSETTSPILDFKSLYSLLSDEYKIVVVERFGYGFSDVVDSPRDIATVLSETRAALTKAGIEGPYVLCPHSLSGLESLYWAQQYPDEVEAIIGLDMAVPEALIDFKDEVLLNTIRNFFTRIGWIRVLPLISDMDCVKYGILTEEEKDIAHAMMYYNFLNKTVLNEFKYISQNAKTVGDGKTPQVPMLLFVSSDKLKKEWPGYIQSYVSNVENANIVQLDCPHYVHDYEYVRISEDIKKYLNEMDN